MSSTEDAAGPTEQTSLCLSCARSEAADTTGLCSSCGVALAAADCYLSYALQRVDAVLGHRGYTISHPELVGAYMQTVAMHIVAKEITSAIENIGYDIARELSEAPPVDEEKIVDGITDGITKATKALYSITPKE
jgi:hypothetical protein